MKTAGVIALAVTVALVACTSSTSSPPGPATLEPIWPQGLPSDVPPAFLTPPDLGVVSGPTDLPIPTPGGQVPSPAPAVLATEVGAYIEILSPPDNPDEPFSGNATVVDIDGEVLTLDLEGRGPLIVQARTRGSPFPIDPNAPRLRVEYAATAGPVEPQERIALSSDDGDALGGILVTGAKPLTTTLTLPDGLVLSAEQVGAELDEAGIMAVDLRLGLETAQITPVDIAEFANWNVGVIASRGPGTFVVEGSEYAMRLIVWRRVPPNF